MTDSTTATVKQKGAAKTGLTEDLAETMAAHLGRYYMAVVELKVDAVTEAADGGQKVSLEITQLEPTTDKRLEDHLRELTRTLDYNRRLDEGQLPLSDQTGPDPKIGDVIAGGQALIERDDDGEPVGLWDGTDDPDDVDDQPNEDDVDEPDDEDDTTP